MRERDPTWERQHDWDRDKEREREREREHARGREEWFKTITRDSFLFLSEGVKMISPPRATFLDLTGSFRQLEKKQRTGQNRFKQVYGLWHFLQDDLCQDGDNESQSCNLLFYTQGLRLLSLLMSPQLLQRHCHCTQRSIGLSFLLVC